MNIKRILLSLFLFTAIAASSQSYQDVVYLKNGSIVKGQIIEQIPTSLLKIEIAGGSIFVYQITEIEKIVKEEIITPPIAKRKKTAPKMGYKGFVDMGGGFPVSYDGDGFFSVHISQGYQFNPFFFVGAGLGVDYHFGENCIFLPLYANGRINFIDNPVSPFFDLKIGYSVYEGKGAFLAPSIGTRFAIDQRCGFTFSVGYNLQRGGMPTYSCYNYNCFNGSTTKTLNGISLKIGLDF